MKRLSAAIALVLVSGGIALAQSTTPAPTTGTAPGAMTAPAPTTNPSTAGQAVTVNPSNPQDMTGRGNPQDLSRPGASNPQDLTGRSR